VPPQTRLRSETIQSELSRPTVIENAKNAEAELLSKLQVSTATPRQIAASTTSAATQAEDQLLAQLHASTPSSIQTVVASQQTVLTAKTSEDTLLKALQVTAPTTTIVTVVPGVKADTTIVGPLNAGAQPAAPSSTYTFSPTPYGTIQVFHNGKLIGTGTASYAQQYGYKPMGPTARIAPQTATATTSGNVTAVAPAPINEPKSLAPSAVTSQPGSFQTTAPSPATIDSPIQPSSIKVVTISPTQTPAASFTPISPVATTGNGAVNVLSSTAGTLNKAWSSQPGQAVLDITMSAGGALLKTTNPIQYVPTAVSLLTDIQTKNFTAATNTIAEQALTTGAQAAAPYLVVGADAVGPQMLIGGVAAGSYFVGEKYVAPLVAPTIGGWMFDAAPGLFTPMGPPLTFSAAPQITTTNAVTTPMLSK
jgi:hypothetical protein